MWRDYPLKVCDGGDPFTPRGARALRLTLGAQRKLGRRWELSSSSFRLRLSHAKAQHALAQQGTSPLRVRREYVVLCLHYRMAREPTLGVVPLRRLVG